MLFFVVAISRRDSSSSYDNRLLRMLRLAVSMSSALTAHSSDAPDM